MYKNEIDTIFNSQREFFKTFKTFDVNYRIKKLKLLKENIKKLEEEIIDALNKDLGKSRTESYMCEIGLTYEEINYMIRNVKKLSRKQKVKTPVAQFAAKSFRLATPYGNVLIISPWNYPFLLTLTPLISAIAAGNTVLLKPSKYSVHTSAIIKKLMSMTFDEKEVAVVYGGRDVNTYLLEKDFNYIFFTGSPLVGKVVYQKAAEKLIPVTLELGGKSPCIVDETANIKLAAKRIIFGKLINAGQTCVAPDYILCNSAIKEQLIEALKFEIQNQYGSNYLDNKMYGKIITKSHFEGVINLIDKSKVIYGGRYDFESLKVEPTIMENITYDDKVMQEEIFGPILPIMTFDDIDDVIENVNSHPNPLALYYFTSDKKRADRVISNCQFGGGCINDTIIHLATTHMPFGGVGESGMGQYHGQKGFETFSHFKSIVDKKTWIDLPMRYQPYKKSSEKMIRKFMK